MFDAIMLSPLHLMRNQFIDLIFNTISIGMLIVTKNVRRVSFKLSGVFWHFLNLTIQCLLLTEIGFELLLVVGVLGDMPLSYFWSLDNPRIGKCGLIKYGGLEISILPIPMIVLIKIGLLINFGRFNFIIEYAAMGWSYLPGISIVLRIHPGLESRIRINVWLVFNSGCEGCGFCSEDVRVLWLLHISYYLWITLYNWIFKYF